MQNELINKYNHNLFNYNYQVFKFDKKIRVFEAFAGMGCQSLALKNINVDFEVVGISEIDSIAVDAYNLIHDTVVNNFGDISNISGQQISDLDIDLFTYSFPCQDLSIIGSQKGLKNTKSSLVYEVLRILKEAENKPKVLILENVKNLISYKFINDFENILEELEKIGYKNYYKILKGIDFNIPQFRERLFVVSILSDDINYKYFFPKKLNQTIFVNNLLEKEVSEKYYLSNKLLKYFNKKVGNFDRAKFFKVLNFNEKNKYIRAITTKEGLTVNSNFIKDKNGIRKLTDKECFRFMGIDDFIFEKLNHKISSSNLRKLAGNGIIVPVLAAVLKNLY